MGRIIAGSLLACGLLLVSGLVARADTACADARSRQFDFWVGDWEVYDAASDRFVGSNSINPILDGCVLQENWRGRSGSAGTSLNFFDTDRQNWRQFWVWREGATLELAGGFRDDRMVLVGDAIASDGKPHRNRITWFANADGTVRQLWEISTDDGSTWRVEFDGIYRRKGADRD